jgi:hypothetical protein
MDRTQGPKECTICFHSTNVTFSIPEMACRHLQDVCDRCNLKLIKNGGVEIDMHNLIDSDYESDSSMDTHTIRADLIPINFSITLKCPFCRKMSLLYDECLASQRVKFHTKIKWLHANLGENTLVGVCDKTKWLLKRESDTMLGLTMSYRDCFCDCEDCCRMHQLNRLYRLMRTQSPTFTNLI